MSTTVSVTTDTLPSNVPKLDIKGANWAIFSLHFQIAVEARELWKQFDGTMGTVAVSPPDADELAQWQKSKNICLTPSVFQTQLRYVCGIIPTLPQCGRRLCANTPKRVPMHKLTFVPSSWNRNVLEEAMCTSAQTSCMQNVTNCQQLASR
ncbi:hypothetical protein K503DRAFT_250746 [Rhizopogon vinicolor AM-OR11-026]|uniref:Uncharacterized protein n=1 Tax=Rhizopogon vinicolor AM-OR11-026 TaxID=1314800 RepID=A0A1B7MX17_9AGAM|nr:hypothetical protein K503DRAFT_250746 [Rhizopogon vinicolor AM-OR11-026]